MQATLPTESNYNQLANLQTSNLKQTNMKTLLKYCGAILVLCGVLCLVIYYFWVPSNALLATSLVLELVGILGYILVNRFIE